MIVKERSDKKVYTYIFIYIVQFRVYIFKFYVCNILYI